MRRSSAASPSPRSRPRLSSAARSSRPRSSPGESSSPVRKCRGPPVKRGIVPEYFAPCPCACSPGTSSTVVTTPPDRSLQTWRSRILRFDERNETHVQVNRDLFDEFGALLSVSRMGRRPAPGVPAALGARPRSGLRRRAPSRAHLAQLARRDPRPARTDEPRPDRLRRGRLQPDPGAPGRRTDRRAPRARAPPRARGRATDDGVHRDRACGRWQRLRREPARERRPLAARARRGGGPARRGPRRASGPTARRSSSGATSTCARARARSIAELERRHSLVGATDLDGLDHLLSRGLEIAEPPRAWAPERREVPGGGGLAIRLSDHAPVEAAFRLR